MALQVSADAQLVFFHKLFGPASPVVDKVKALIGTGLTFEVSLYAVRAVLHGKQVAEPVKLSAGTTALMKGTVEAVVFGHNKTLIADWVNVLHLNQGAPTAAPAKPVSKVSKVVLTGLQPQANLLPVVKAVHILFGGNKTLGESKAIVVLAQGGEKMELVTFPTYADAVAASQKIVAAGGIVQVESSATPTPVVPVAPATPKPTNSVIFLKDAKALGQKVHGTSSGSVYYTIALTDAVKVAARLHADGAVSIRAEWQGHPDHLKSELEKLTVAGLSVKGNYGSIHFDAAGVPIQRVIGAFLMGTGIPWTAVVTNGADLVVNG